MKKGLVRSGSTSVRRPFVSIDLEGRRVDKLQRQAFQLQPALRKEQGRSRGEILGHVAHQDPSQENPFDKILLS